MTDDNTARLFGLKNSNRDFTTRDAWGKNHFNSSFPAALCCYLHSKNQSANYLSIQKGIFAHADLAIEDAFGIAPLGDDTFYAFESAHTPFQKYIIGTLPRTDLVIQSRNSGHCVTGIEVKLTALPDNTTCELPDSAYGSEIVVRPDTIVYLACSIGNGLGNELKDNLNNSIKVADWSDAQKVLPYVAQIVDSIKKLAMNLEQLQTPFLLQPIWKTTGKSPQLANKCLDVFFWSDAGFATFITEIADTNPKATKITRQTRTAIWLYKMLKDIADNGRFNHEQIIDAMSYNTKNDKAFASSGNVTNKFMMCDRLETPVVAKSEIKNIILGGGQNLLSPERRFDAIIFNSPELFQ